MKALLHNTAFAAFSVNTAASASVSYGNPSDSGKSRTKLVPRHFSLNKRKLIPLGTGNTENQSVQRSLSGMSLSKTESVHIHNNLYSRHSQSSLMVEKYREFDRLANTRSSDAIHITAGSKAEGLTCFNESDWDFLFVLKSVLCVEAGINLHTIPDDIDVFRMDTRVYPGHCRLLQERRAHTRFDKILNSLCDNGYGAVLLSSSRVLRERGRVYVILTECTHYAVTAPASYKDGLPEPVIGLVSLGAYLTPHMEWRMCFNTADITDMMDEGPRVILRLQRIRQAVIASPKPMLWFSKIRMEFEMLLLQRTLNRFGQCSDEHDAIRQEINRRQAEIVMEVAQRMRIDGCAVNDLEDIFFRIVIGILLSM
ncbi:hypothetical protein DPMN_039477 [Dreissena polymorpha]|uniref:Uncharacterized protein n=1 Tax=Dreissena polymorpha TaxID=45954 RepID=A0A9D4CWA2_DREPO|nr:hypothetical protein DPMN_039477 [Dreissena polymorpha]